MTIKNTDDALIKRRAEKPEPQKWTNTKPDVGHKVLMSDASSNTGASCINRLLIPVEIGDTGRVANMKIRYLEGNLANSATVNIRHGCKGKVVGVLLVGYNDSSNFFQHTQEEHGFSQEGDYVKFTSLHADFRNNEYRILVFYFADSEEDDVK